MSEELKQSLLTSVREASQMLLRATTAVKVAHPLAEAVPVIMEIDKMARRLNGMLQELNKLRGL